MLVKIFDTAHKDYVEFAPPADAPVRIYVCGITPYDSAHLGHIFTFMTYDLLQRRLEDMGHEVRLVRNITDVDEPIYAKARELGLDYRELAADETASFQLTLEELNFRKPFAEPRASEYIDQMAAAVKVLLDKDFAYKLEDDIYFDVAKYPAYEKFSGFNERLIHGLARMRGGDPDRAGKRNPLDFLLWKGIQDADDPAQWETVVGTGRPGWHIECSVMSAETLGVPFDIHGGGSDLIFPHHSSEIAQSHGLGEPVMARHWLHVSPMLFDGEKMSKSLGNLVFAHDLLSHHSPAVIRLALMHYHHRVGGEWIPELLVEGERLFARVKHCAPQMSAKAGEQLLHQVRKCLDDDLNTLEVIDAFHDFVNCHDKEGGAEPFVAQTFELLGLE